MKSLWRIIKLVAKLEPRLWPANIVQILCESAAPYIDMLLGAWVLDRLIAGAGISAIIPTVIKVLALRLGLKFINEIATQIVWARGEHMKDMFMALRCEKNLSMDYEELSSPAVNKLRDRMNNDDMYGWGIANIFDRLSMMLSNTVSMITAAIIVIPMISFSGGSMIYLGGTAAAALAMAVFRGRTTKKRHELADGYQDARSHSSYYLWGGGVDYKMGKDIRVYGAQPMIENAINADEDERTGRRRYVLYDRRISAFTGGWNGLLQGSSYVYVILSALSGSLSAGQVVKFASSIYKFWNDLSSFTGQIASLSEDCKRMEDTLAFMDLSSGRAGGDRPVPSLPEAELEFRNVSFTYPGANEPALNNVSCTVKRGERIAVVGQNGSGKTTFIKLLCRLYHPSEGEILLNGINIEEYKFDEYIRLLSVVFQDFALFPFTLGENVAADEAYDREAVERTLDIAGFGERYGALAKGCETVLYKDYEDEGVDVSGGEAQKIALARALYKDAPFMVLDEPTAALDPVAEYEIYSRFNGFTSGKGAIYISHRLSSCVFCDRIMVFENGRIVQSGRHEELVAAEGLYSRLWDAQAKYYKD